MNILLSTLTAGQSIMIVFGIIMLLAILAIGLNINADFNDTDDDIIIINKKNKSPQKIKEEYNSLYVEEKLKSNRKRTPVVEETIEIVEEVKQKPARVVRVKKVKTE